VSQTTQQAPEVTASQTNAKCYYN